MSFYTLPCLRRIDEAAQLISSNILRTPVVSSQRISNLASLNLKKHCAESAHKRMELFFKCENLQYSGSFKFRGASHFLARRDDESLKRGVVAYSTGNHAQAVALAAQQASKRRGFRIPTSVVVPQNCPQKKIDAARAYGSTVHVCDPAPEARVNMAKSIHNSTGAVIVPPADHIDIVLGQATAISELLHQVEEMGNGGLDAVIVPSGGGGLLVGGVAACKPRDVVVFGAEPAHGGPGLTEAIRCGKRTNRLENSHTIADGLRTLTGDANWEHLKSKENVKDVFTTTEDEIKNAMRLAADDLGFIIEPSAAVALAVVVYNKFFHQTIAAQQKEMRIGVVLTGSNIDVRQLKDLVPGISTEGLR